MTAPTKTTISFNDLEAGTLVRDQFASEGVIVTSSDANPAMIFDASQDPHGPVSGNDTDLLNASAGGILIASEDGDGTDPDDNAGGATIGFRFEDKVVLNGITLADVDDGATVIVRDEGGRLLFEQTFTSGDGEFLEIEFEVPGARSMDVVLHGSGGIDDVIFTRAVAPDGIVNGTSDDDLIDLDYVDVDGDVIDGNDAIGVKGTIGDDDFVIAGDGDDTVFAGEGNDLVRGNDGDDLLYGEAGMDTLTGGLGDDTAWGGDGMDEIITFRGDDVARGEDGNDWIWGGDGDDTLSGDAGDDMVSGEGDDDLLFGGSGDDTVDGGAGNDTIFGDSDPDTADRQGDPICGARESFNWAEVAGFANGAAAGDTVQNTGTVDVTFSVKGATGRVTDRFETDTQRTEGIDGGAETVDDDASFASILRGEESSASYGFAFSSQVKNASFNVNDIDRDSVVTVRAFDADGAEVPVTLTGGSKVAIDGATATSRGGSKPDSSEAHSLNVSIEGVASRIEILHATDGNAQSGVNITDLFFDPVIGFEEVPPVAAGDDLLKGGVGADMIDGEGGDDTIDGGTGDDMLSGGDGDDSILGGDGDDKIDGGDGDDTIAGGAGNDTVTGGAGNDSIDGDDGDDVLRGGGGQDTVSGGAGDDSVSGSANDDLLSGGEGDDTVSGSGGNDTVSGGDGDDTVLGGKGDDDVSGGKGNDKVSGGAGNDKIASGIVGAPDLGYPGLFEGDEDPSDDLDTVDGGDGDDTIRTGDDDDLVTGGAGDDVIDGGFDRDTISGDDGDDFIVGGEGSDKLSGGAGNDTIYGGLDPKFPDDLNVVDTDADGETVDLVQDNGRDMIDGGDGDDLIFGQDDDDMIDGGAGDDTIDGGIDEDIIDGGDGADVITGGQGGDTITGGEGPDMIDGGADRDVILGATTGDMIDGGETGDDFDTLDLTGSGVSRIDYTSEDREDGIITFDDDTTAKFEEIENVIPCFTPGTLIATPLGEVPVEALQVGDRVLTRDNGMQTIRWVGRRDMTKAELRETEAYRPVVIRQGALGNDLPERDMIVSPQHRVLVVGDDALLYFEEREVLIAARHLVGRPGIERMAARDVSYIHVMFDAHQVILSDGAWTESFQPGEGSLAGLHDAQREELLALFPELRTDVGREGYMAARRALKRREAALLNG